MALFWIFLASFLIANSVANARNIWEQNFQRVNDENSDIAKYRVEKDQILQRRDYHHGNGFERCQMGTSKEECYPNLCQSKSVHVHFPQHFEETPSVSVSLSGLDVDKNFNLRVRSSVTDVTTSSFNIKYETWADTKVYEVRFSWIACA